MKNLLIYGSGDFGKELVNLISLINKRKKTWKILGFVENNKKLIGKKIYNIKIFDEKKIKKNKLVYVICSATNPKTKKKIISKIKNKFSFTNLIHPDVEMPKDLKIGVGNIILQKVFISYKVKIKNYCSISTSCDLGHNLKLGNCSSIMPGTIINGRVTIENECFIGSSVLISTDVKIGNNCNVGSGCKIFNNIKDNTRIFEVPRLIKSKNI